MNVDAPSSSTGTAQAMVEKKLVGMMFWIWGEQGLAVIVNVKAPRARVAGIKQPREPGSVLLRFADPAPRLWRARQDSAVRRSGHGDRA